MVLSFSLAWMKTSAYSFGSKERGLVAELMGELGGVQVADQVDESAHTGCRCHQEDDDCDSGTIRMELVIPGPKVEEVGTIVGG